MVKSAVRVVLRVRPAAGVNPQAHYSGDNKGVTLTVPKTQDVTGTLQLDKGQSYQFKFDGVLRDVGQDEVYEACATDVLQSALQGFNGTIMCYGQTGAGKTFTMSGGRSSFKQRGIIPRMITHLFADMRTLSDRSFKVSIQYLEIYNESLYDLLDITTQPHELNIFESARGSVSVSGLRSQVVHSEAEAMGLLFEGETNRVIGEHQLNRESSRSHSIFTIMLEMKMPGDAGEIVTSKVNLVDLAGSERVSKTKSEGLVLREACHINKSLSILEQVSLALSSKGRDHVPFRSSKLTHVLKDSLGGNCKTVLIANMWGEASQMDETLSTCRFAQRMMCITCEVSANVVEDQSVKARQLQRQIQELQQELAMHDAMAGRKDVAYAPYNDTQRGELTAMVQAFLTSPGPSDSIEPLDLISVRHMREILYCCRELYARRGGGTSSGGAAAGASQPPPPPALAATNGRPASSSSSTAAAGTPTARLAASASGRAIAADKDWSEYVGDEDSAGGAGQAGGVGVAPEGARPQDPGAGGASVVARLLALQQQDAPPPLPGRAGTGASAGPSSTARGGATAGVPPMDRHEALEVFKAGPGSSKASLLEENRSRLKGVKRRAKELGLSINTIKRDLDSLKARADELKAQRQAQQGDGAQVLDAEEYDTLMRVKELKQQYRDQFAELQMVRSEVEYTQQLCDTCAQELALEFNEWYSAAHGGSPAGTLDLNGVYPDEDPETSGNGPGSPSAKSMASFYAPSVVSTASKATSSKSGVLGRTGIVPGSGGTAQAGARTGGGTGAQARAAAPAAKGTPVVSKPQARKVLSSLVTPPEDAGDPEAQAYYNAQTHLIQHTNGHRPGSVKKARERRTAMTDLADVPAARPSRPSRTNAGSRMTKLLCAETKSLKTFTKEAADELKASGIRVDRKRERERERAPHHREEAVSSDGDAENAMHEGEENSPEVAEPAAEAGGAEAGLAAAKPSRGAAAAGGAQLSKTALDQIPRRGIDRMPGCPKCRFSKGGCNGCLRTPMVTRPAVRWNPEKAHPQKDIPSADTVYPTAEEFADPLAYIESIRHLGEKCGVVCIVPPPGWDPPFALHPTAAASAATAAGAAAAAAAATTAAVPGGKDTSKEDSTALRFQVRKQFTSHLCMRAPSSSFQTESRAKGLGSPEAEPCRMMGGGGRMGGGGSGRMGGGGGSAGRMGGGMGRNNACAVGMAAKATESPLAAWQRPGAPEGAGSAAQPSSAIVCVPAEVPAVKLPVCVVAPAAALRGGGRARAAPRRSARAYEDDSECSDPTVEERAGRGGSGRSLAASAAPQLLPSSPIAATARVAIPAVSPCAPAARIPAAVLDPALGAAGRGRRAAQPRRRRGGRAGKDTDEEEEEGEFVSDDGVSQETQSEDEPQLGRGRRGLQRRAAAAAAAARRQMQGDGSDDDENTSTDDELGGEFGHGLLDRSHTLKSFMAYAEWAKAKHFGLAAGGGGGGSGMTDAARRAAQRGSWVPNNWQPGRRAAAAQPRPPPPPPLAPTPPPPGAEPGSEPAAAEPCMRGTRGGGRTAAHDGDVAAGPGRGAAAGPSGRNELTMEELEAEFWRIVESPSQVVETLYGSDLDSGRHGSGFPLPHWRAAPTDASAVRPPKEDARCAEYSAHPWNINCLTRSKGSVLRYVRCKELVTGVMVPWLYVGSCMSAFCWHVEDHALYSINYLHLGAPKVWYGIPAYAAEAFEAAMHDALPHLFVEDPLLLHRLVTMLSPNQLKARGVPVYRLVHQPGSFVITFPNAYHAGFNTGFNCAEAVNFAPADWLPYGTDVLRKYRTQGKPLTISHDQLLVTLVQAAPLVAKAQARKQQQQQQQQQEQEGGTSDAMDTSHAGPSSGGGTAEGCEGLDLYGEGGWMQRWQDGASMSDVPVQAVLIATGELAVRVDEEEARRAAAAAAGVSKEEVMSGNCEAEQDSRGLHVDTGDCDCEVCKCDLYMSAVVSELVPGRCVCPNHVAALGVDPASCKLLYRFSMPQLHSMLQTATKLFPASEQHMQQARARQEAKPVVTAKPLGPVVRFGPDGERLGEGVKAEGEKEGEEGRQGGKAKVKVEAKEEGDGMDDDPEEEEEQEQEEEEEEEEERHGRRGRGSRRQPAHGRAGRAAPQPKRLMHAKVEPTVMQLQQQPFPPPPPPLSPPTSPSGRRAARGAAAAAASGDGVPAHSGRSAAAVVSPRAQQGASASNAAAAGGVAGVAVVGPAVSCVPRVAARRSKQGLVGDAKLAAAAAIGGYRTPGAQQGHAVVDGAAAADTASASPVRGIGGRGGDDRAAAAQARAPVTTGLAGNVMPPPPPPLFAAKLTASVASEAAAGAAAAAEAAAAAAAAAEAIAAAAAAKAVQGASVTAGGTKRRRTPAVEVEAEVGRDDTDGSDEAREECFAFGAKRRRTTRRAGGAPAARWKAAAASLPAWPLPQSPDATPKAPAAAPVRRGPGAAAPAAAAGGGSFAIPEDLMAWARASGAPAAPAAAAALLPAQPQQPQPQQAPPAAHQVSSSLAHLQALLASPSAGGGAAAVNPFLRPPATVAPQQLQQPQQPLAAFGALLSNPTATMAMAAALLAMTSRQAQQGQQGHQPAAGGMPVQPSAPAVHVVAPSGAPAAHQQQ